MAACCIGVLPGTLPPTPEALVVGDCALFNPCGLCVSSNGEVYIADTGHHRICVLQPNGVLRVLAGSGVSAFGSARSAGLGRRRRPGQARPPRTRAKRLPRTRRRPAQALLEPAPTPPAIVPGRQQARGFADAAGLDAAFAHPCGVAIDSDGMLYVADCGNHRIRRVSPEGVVSTVAGSGSADHRDGQGRAAAFYDPCGIAIDSNVKAQPPTPVSDASTPISNALFCLLSGEDNHTPVSNANILL